MTAPQQSRLSALCARIFAEKSPLTASEWCTREVVFNEPDCRGRFSLAGREYLREPLDNWGRQDVTDQVCVMAPRTGKTRILYGGIAWTIIHAPARVLYVKPKTKGAAGAEDDARTRFLPMLRSSAALAALIPTGGQKRHEFKIPQQNIGGAIIDWTGSNSVAALASNPCRVVVQDEVEKFNTTRKRDDEGNIVEADSSALADERCKEFANPKRFKASTPTLTSGKIWEELTKKSDFRRYFVPCPHCGKFVLLAWSDDFTALPRLGCEAWMKWDQAAKREDGTWDKALVEQTAHYECPHCKGSIEDRHKPAMIAAGEWRATREGSRGYRGYHLPAMYALHTQCGAGALACRFLDAVKSLEGPRGFINNDLAEPYSDQGTGAKRREAINTIEVGAEWKKLVTVDCQRKAPHFWFVKRAYGGKDIVGLAYGQGETWDDVRAFQGDDVKDVGVIVDSGYGAKDDAEVYRTCAEHGTIEEDHAAGKILHFGWMPAKGVGGRWKRPCKETKLMVPWMFRPIDPFMGTDKAGRITMELFEFATDLFSDVLARLRDNRDPRYAWTIAGEMDTEEYRVHMHAQIVNEKGVWVKRYRNAQDHLYDCERMQVAAAFAFELLTLKDNETKTEN